MQWKRANLALFAGLLMSLRLEAQEPPEFVIHARAQGQTVDPLEDGRFQWHRSSRPEWEQWQALLQGYIGITANEDVSLDGGSLDPVDGAGSDLDQLGVLGGGCQIKLGGERVDLGIETMVSFSGRANVQAFAFGGSGAAVALDVDLLLVDLYGGPFASAFLGDRLRVYGAVGPLLQFAEWDQSSDVGDENGSGFGFGTYARAGFEFVLPSNALLGFGVRWSESSVDLGSNLGDLDLEGLQAFVTLSRWD